MIKIQKRNKNVNLKEVNSLVKKYNVSKKVISLLLNRGYKEEDIKKMLTSDINILATLRKSITNVDKAAQMLADAIRDDNSEIYIYADYDCDGITSASISKLILTDIVESLGSKCKITIKVPNRYDGYGLSLKWCKETFPKKVDKNIIVMTVDNGITKKEEVEYLKSVGVNVIITDHHYPKEGEVPDTLIVDAWLHDLDNKEALGLCGATVAFNVYAELLDILGDSEYIYNFIPNVAIATITDVMPVTEYNVALLKTAFYMFEEGITVPSLSFYRQYNGDALCIKDFAFGIGPIINSCGRVGESQLAYDFLIAEDKEEVRELFIQASLVNDSVKAKRNQVVESLSEVDFSNDVFIVVHVNGVEGITGNIATKLVEKYKKPVVVLTGNGDIISGSARSINGIKLHELFKREVELGNALYYGGHQVACGVEIRADKIEDFKLSLNKLLKTIIVEEDCTEQEDIVVEVDDIINIKDINKRTFDAYHNDILYFNDLKEPIFALENIEVVDYSLSKSNKNNIKINIIDNSTEKEKEIWLWGKADEMKEVLSYSNKIDLIGSIVKDFRNKRVFTLDVQWFGISSKNDEKEKLIC